MPKRKPAQATDQEVALFFPSKGLDLSGGYTLQRPGTTPIATNVRAFEPGSDRMRGGSRPGIVKYVGSQVSGTHVIQELNAIFGSGFTMPGTSPVAGDGVIGVPGASTGTLSLIEPDGTVTATSASLGTTAPRIAFDDAGNVYAVSSSNADPSILKMVKYSSGGTLVWSANIPTPEQDGTGPTVIHSISTSSQGKVEVTFTPKNRPTQGMTISQTRGTVLSKDPVPWPNLPTPIQPTLPGNHPVAINGPLMAIVPGNSPGNHPTMYLIERATGFVRGVRVNGVDGITPVTGYNVTPGEAGGFFLSGLDTSNTNTPNVIARINSGGGVDWSVGSTVKGISTFNWYNAPDAVTASSPLDLAYINNAGLYQVLAVCGRYQAGNDEVTPILTLDGLTGDLSGWPSSPVTVSGGVVDIAAAEDGSGFLFTDGPALGIYLMDALGLIGPISVTIPGAARPMAAGSIE